MFIQGFRTLFPLALLFIGLALFPAPCPGGTSTGAIVFDDTELTPREKDFFLDFKDGRTERYTPYDAFLIASGITMEPDFSRYREKLGRIRRQARQALVDADRDPYSLGKALLLWLHDHVLKEYHEEAADAASLLDSGRFNCLSSSILYALLASEFELKVSGITVPDHAFCLLSDPRGDKDIETTVRYGFDPGTREIERLKEQTRYVYVPKSNYRARNTVGLYPLIGLVYVGGIHLPQRTTGNEDRDLPRLKKQCYFDPHAPASRNNLIACLNNLAVREMKRGNLKTAKNYIAQGRRFAPKEKAFENLEAQYYSECAALEAQRGNHEKATGLMREGLRASPSNESLRHNIACYYASWAGEYTERKDYRAAARILDEGLTQTPGDKILLHNLKTAYYNSAVTEFNDGDYVRAAKTAGEALQRFPGDKNLSALKLNIQKKTGRARDSSY